MTDDASARRDDAAEQADDRFVEALLEASKPEEAAGEAAPRGVQADRRDPGGQEGAGGAAASAAVPEPAARLQNPVPR